MCGNKAAIVTFHRAVNYGAVLQAYALQKCLNTMGVDNDVLDYRCPAVESQYYTIVKYQKSLKNILKNILYYPRQQKRNRQFESFRKQYLNLSAPYSKKNVSESRDKYDFFISGSDQVWNLGCSDGDGAYFLDFVADKKKLRSYGASLGKLPENEEDKEYIIKNIERFNNISVRELEGKEFLSKRIKDDITVDVDPTFLLNKEEWESIAENVKIKDYVLLYSVNLSGAVLSAARKIAKDKGLKLVIITLRKRSVDLKSGEYDASDSSPNMFLGYIKNARIVVTNSFHGTALSVNMEKDFYLVRNEAGSLDNSRLDTLLKRFLLEERAVTEKDLEFLTYESIDYTKVKPYLEEARRGSEENLKNILGI